MYEKKNWAPRLRSQQEKGFNKKSALMKHERTHGVARNGRKRLYNTKEMKYCNQDFVCVDSSLVSNVRDDLQLGFHAIYDLLKGFQRKFPDTKLFYVDDDTSFYNSARAIGVVCIEIGGRQSIYRFGKCNLNKDSIDHILHEIKASVNP